MHTPSFLIGFGLGLGTLVLFVIAGFILGPWVRALTSGVPVPLIGVVGMRLRRSPPHMLIEAYVSLKKRNIQTTMTEVETIYLSHREHLYTSMDLVDQVIAAKRTG